MRKIFVIAAREYKAAVKTKSFLIGIILLPILMGGGFLAQMLVGNQVDTRPKRFAVIDRTRDKEFLSLLTKAADEHNEKQAAGAPVKTAPFLLESPPAAITDVTELRLNLSGLVRKGELTGFLEVGPEVLEPTGDGTATVQPMPSSRLDVHALRYQTNRPSYQDFAKWAETIVNSAVRERRAQKNNVPLEDLKVIVAAVPLLSKGLTTRDPQTGVVKDAPDQSPIVAILLPGGLMVLMFMMVMIGAAPLLQGVIEEKLQRIAEVLLGSVQPFALMMGKIIGMTCVSLTMAAIYLAGVFWAVQSYGVGEYLSVEILAWFLVYQILALFMFGSIYTAVGAACSELKEAQALLMPITILSMIPLFIWINVVREPTSTFSTIASFLPPFTPMLMVARLAVPPGIPVWQPVLGVILVLATTLLCVYAAGRVFRVGILLQGKGAHLADLARWVFRG